MKKMPGLAHFFKKNTFLLLFPYGRKVFHCLNGHLPLMVVALMIFDHNLWLRVVLNMNLKPVGTFLALQFMIIGHLLKRSSSEMIYLPKRVPIVRVSEIWIPDLAIVRQKDLPLAPSSSPQLSFCKKNLFKRLDNFNATLNTMVERVHSKIHHYFASRNCYLGTSKKSFL